MPPARCDNRSRGARGADRRCDRLAVQRHIYWPAVIRDRVIVWLVIVILCFAEIGTTKPVAAPGRTAASVRAFDLIHAGVDGNLAVLAILSLMIILALWLWMIGTLKWRPVCLQSHWPATR